MPIPAISSRVPMVGAPARVDGMTLVVVVTCQQCKAGEQLALVNAQPATCPSCGATVSLEQVQWDRKNPVPRIELNASRPLPTT